MITLKASSSSCLLINISDEWGTREKTTLIDAKILAREGYKVWVYALKDSYLAREVVAAGLELMPHTGPWVHSGFSLLTPKALRQILKSESFKSVHLYQLNMLWPISHSLRNKRGTSLFVSLFEDFSQSYRGVWYRPYVHRVDRYLLWGFLNQEVLASDLGVHQRRLTPMGLPPGLDTTETSESIARTLEEQKQNHFMIGFEVAPHIERIEEIDPFLQACSQLQKKEEAKLILYRRYPWRESIIWADLEKRLFDLGIFERTFALDAQAINIIPSFCDLWLSTPDCESTTVEFLLKGVPFLAPRTPFFSELIHQTGAGDSYRSQDLRELRQKIESARAGQVNVLPLPPEFYEGHGPGAYEKALVECYRTSIDYRYRIAKKIHLTLDS